MSMLCLVEHDPVLGESLADRFALEGMDARWFRSAEEAEGPLRSEPFAVVVCDIRLPDVTGDKLFERLRATRPVVPPFVFLTGCGDLGRAPELLTLGAADYITKPFDPDRLIARVHDLLAGGRPAGASRLGVSAAMARVERLLARLAPLDTTVLVRGETGSGKEIVARRLHRLSGREPFIAVHCAALAEGLAESELFGQEKGAFTGAQRVHPGVFERADGGTLFFDEIGDLPLPLQGKLLRVLQERAVVRVGGRAPIPVDTRLVLATHQNLEQRVADGRFREDLLFHIKVVELRLPPLRKRREDIVWLARRFLADCNERRGGAESKRTLTADAVNALESHDWPGNVRELRHTIERACIVADGEALTAADLFQPGLGAGSRPAATDPSVANTDLVELAPTGADASLDDDRATGERNSSESRLKDSEGRATVTAKVLGINRKSLWERMKRLDIRKKD
jgi:two-component system, NtrC family, response regulator HydG